MSDEMNKMHGVKVAGRRGTWYAVEAATVVGKGRCYLMESEQWGDEAAWILVDAHGKEIDPELEIYNGWLDVTEAGYTVM